MGKIYRGYELFKAIASEEIKKKQKVRMIFNDGSGENYIFDGDDIVDSTHYNIFKIYGTKAVLKAEFELIENEIDIDSIEEYKQEHTERCIDVDTRNKINEILQAVKQIDKRVKKIEEKYTTIF